jgi:hypothetical protein
MLYLNANISKHYPNQKPTTRDYASSSKSAAKVHKQLSELKRDPTKCQPREIPLKDEFFGHVCLEIYFRINTFLTPSTFGWRQISSQSSFKLLDTNRENAEVDIV